MADRFFTSQPLGCGAITLDGDEAHHLAVVRRFAVGDRVTLFNGDGCEYPAEVQAVGKKQIVLAVVQQLAISRELPQPVVVGSALPKGDRLDYLLEKLTEVGVNRFVPLTTNRSVVMPKEAKLEKWMRVVVEASKQCGRNVLMSIDAPKSLAAFLADSILPQQRYLLHTSAETIAAPTPEAEIGCTFAIGPEGGFTPDEVATATTLGWQPLQLGTRILRVETAGVVAATWAAMRLGV